MTNNDDVLVNFSAIEKNLQSYKLRNMGTMAIPINKIIGSLGRYLDFSKTFLPKKMYGTSRYEHIKSLIQKGIILAPIQVYQILDNYFIIDGHHRVSVAKNEFGAEYIDAEVTEINFNYTLSKDQKYIFDSENTKNFLIKLEENSFQCTTFLNNQILICPLQVTELKSFAILNQEILDFKQSYHNGELAKKPVIFSSYEWYAKRFLPAIEMIQKENIMAKFKNRTFTDLYVWLQRHKYYLSQQIGHDVGFSFTTHDFMNKSNEKNFLNIIPTIFNDVVNFLTKQI